MISAYKNISRTAGSKYKAQKSGMINLNALAVQDTADRVSSKIYTNTNSNLKTLNLFKEELKVLRKVLEKVTKLEANFFNTTGIKDLKELQSKIDTYNNSGLTILTNSRFGEIEKGLHDNGFKTNVSVIEVQKQIIQENLHKIVLSDNFQDVINAYCTNKTEETFLRIFNELGHGNFLTQKQISNLPAKFIKSGGRSLFGSIQIKVVPMGEKSTINIDWNDDADYFVKKLYRITEEQLNKKTEDFSDKLTIIGALKKIVLNKISDPLVRAMVSEEMSNDQLIQSYGLNNSTAQLKGYLGEVHLNVLLKLLFGKSGVVIRNTGNLKDYTQKQSIGIDTVLNSFGFQVKNYDISDGRLSFEGVTGYKGSMASLLKRIMGDKPMKYDELIAELYGAIQFNQPITNNGEGSQSLEEYTSFYESQLKPLGTEAENYFKYSIDRIMRVRQAFSVEKDSVFGQTKMYFNTFFFVNGKLVPSSAILKTIIDVLANKIDESNYRFSMAISYSSEPQYGTVVVEARKNDNQPQVPDIWEILKKVKVNIDYSFDLNYILQRALNQIS